MWILAEIVLKTECEWAENKKERVVSKMGDGVSWMCYKCVYLILMHVFFAHLLCGIHRCRTISQLNFTSHQYIQNTVIKLSKDNRGDTISQLESMVCVFEFASWFEYALPSAFRCCINLGYFEYIARNIKTEGKEKNRKMNARKRQK